MPTQVPTTASTITTGRGELKRRQCDVVRRSGVGEGLLERGVA